VPDGYNPAMKTLRSIIGWIAPVTLLALRMLQGLALGGDVISGTVSVRA
jgi:hypothetical protein